MRRAIRHDYRVWLILGHQARERSAPDTLSCERAVTIGAPAARVAIYAYARKQQCGRRLGVFRPSTAQTGSRWTEGEVLDILVQSRCARTS